MPNPPEEMTMEEIKEQLAIYGRLYYRKKKEDEAFMMKKRERTHETI